MKKITLSVAALAIAISSYGQSAQFGIDSTEVTNVSLKAKSQHKNLYKIVIRAEDMRTMLEKDIDSGYMYKQYAEFYDNLLADIIKLAANVNIDSVINEVYIHEGLYVTE